MPLAYLSLLFFIAVYYKSTAVGRSTFSQILSHNVSPCLVVSELKVTTTVCLCCDDE